MSHELQVRTCKRNRFCAWITRSLHHAPVGVTGACAYMHSRSFWGYESRVFPTVRCRLCVCKRARRYLRGRIFLARSLAYKRSSHHLGVASSPVSAQSSLRVQDVRIVFARTLLKSLSVGHSENCVVIEFLETWKSDCVSRKVLAWTWEKSRYHKWLNFQINRKLADQVTTFLNCVNRDLEKNRQRVTEFWWTYKKKNS